MTQKSMLLASIAALSVGGAIRFELEKMSPTGTDCIERADKAIYFASMAKIEPGEVPATLLSIDKAMDRFVETDDSMTLATTHKIAEVKQAVLANARRSAENPVYAVLFEALGYKFDQIDDVQTPMFDPSTTAGAGKLTDDRVVHASAAA